MSSSRVRISVDKILESLGVTGRYQIWQSVVLCLTNFSVAFHLFTFVFIAQPVKHECENKEVPGNSNDTDYNTCDIASWNTTLNQSRTFYCQSWKYAVGKEHSIVSDWDLVCKKVVFGRLPQSLFIVGQGIGAVLFSNLSDRWGRKPFLILAHVLTAGAGLGLAFAPNIVAFSILRLLNGVFQQGLVVIGVTLLLETFPRSYRVESSLAYALVWSVCTMCLALMAYLIRHLTWRMQQLAFMSVSLSLFLQLLFLKESLRWLITNKKMKEAMSIIQHAATLNHVDMSTVHLQGIEKEENLQDNTEIGIKYVEDSVAQSSETNNKDETQYNCLDLFRSRFVLKISIIIWITWLIDSLTYFSLYLTSSSLADDLYLNFFLNSLAEVPSGPLLLIIGKRFGRRKFFMIFHILAGVCLLTATFIRTFTDDGTSSIAATIIAFFGKVGTTACFNGLFIYAPEVYPTNMRTVGFGAGSFAGRVGGCISPFIQILATAVPWASGTIFGILCLMVAALDYHLPE